MVELGVREGFSPPADLPSGECMLATLYDDDDQPCGIHVVRADPRILISGELFEGWHDQDDSPTVTLRCTCENCPDSDDTMVHCPIGDVVTLRGVNRTVIYRITGHVPAVHGYIGEWPD
jgi:hypothetical protein